MTDHRADDAPTRQCFTLLGQAWDVDLAIALIAATPDRPVQPLDVASAARALCLEKSADEYFAAGLVPLLRGEVDEDYARTADLSVPVIMADLERRRNQPPSYMLIDGTHRLRRAYLDGLESLPAYVMDRAEVRRIRIR